MTGDYDSEETHYVSDVFSARTGETLSIKILDLGPDTQDLDDLRHLIEEAIEDSENFSIGVSLKTTKKVVQVR